MHGAVDVLFYPCLDSWPEQLGQAAQHDHLVDSDNRLDRYLTNTLGWLCSLLRTKCICFLASLFFVKDVCEGSLWRKLVKDVCEGRLWRVLQRQAGVGCRSSCWTSAKCLKKVSYFWIFNVFLCVLVYKRLVNKSCWVLRPGCCAPTSTNKPPTNHQQTPTNALINHAKNTTYWRKLRVKESTQSNVETTPKT